jgi:hypothetical protein
MFRRLSAKISTGTLPAIALLALFTLSCSSGGINGKWIAQLPGRDGQTRETTFNFKADGNKLTGTVSGRQGDNPISDGEINGDDISFTVTANVRGNEVKVLYKGKLAGKEIKFTRSREGGEDQTPQEFTAKKS